MDFACSGLSLGDWICFLAAEGRSFAERSTRQVFEISGWGFLKSGVLLRGPKNEDYNTLGSTLGSHDVWKLPTGLQAPLSSAGSSMPTLKTRHINLQKLLPAVRRPVWNGWMDFWDGTWKYICIYKNNIRTTEDDPSNIPCKALRHSSSVSNATYSNDTAHPSSPACKACAFLAIHAPRSIQKQQRPLYPEI